MSTMVTRPVIRSVTITPNPADAGGTFLIAADVAEITAEAVPETVYLGELLLGEGDWV